MTTPSSIRSSTNPPATGTTERDSLCWSKAVARRAITGGLLPEGAYPWASDGAAGGGVCPSGAGPYHPRTGQSLAGAGLSGRHPITRQLLNHWNHPERERKLFFCQREAAETIIWLVEASPAEKQGIDIPKDNGLTRYACKMATGSGKTVVMGMVIAWQVLNKLAYPQDRRFSDAVLIVCPNLTICERLQVLLPWHKRNYYETFDLVPRGMMERLQQGKFEITNWHLFQPKDDSRSRSVVQRGAESDTAFCRRVLKELGNKQNILVINDEAHHAYRPAPLPDELREKLSSEEIAEREEATVWVSGLDRIHTVRGINFCVDFSATPFYIKGSGHPEGKPFPWIVSDFGLVDAIEAGIVKIPLA